MAQAAKVALSRNEESVLYRVGLGISSPQYLAAREVEALQRLALVEEHAGTFRLTTLGEMRMDRLHQWKE